MYAKGRHTGRTVLRSEEAFAYWLAVVFFFQEIFLYSRSNGESTGQTFANIFSCAAAVGWKLSA